MKKNRAEERWISKTYLQAEAQFESSLSCYEYQVVPDYPQFDQGPDHQLVFVTIIPA